MTAPFAAAAPVRDAHTEVELIAENKSIQPGVPFWIGFRMAPEKGWHNYWKNPGDAGMAASVKWQLPEGFNAREIEWPAPEKIATKTAVSYGYEREVLLMVRIEPPADFAAPAAALTAQLRWVACAEICVWAKKEFSLELPVSAAAPEPGNQAGLFAEARQELPGPPDGWNLKARSSGREIIIEGQGPAFHSLEDLYFFPAEKNQFDYSIPQSFRLKGGGNFELTLRRSVNAGEINRLKGVFGPADGPEAGPAVELDLPV